jgi:hypothetical protein
MITLKTMLRILHQPLGIQCQITRRNYRLRRHAKLGNALSVLFAILGLSGHVMLTSQNGRKQKPLTRDFDGQWGQTLAVAKLQLFAYALAEAPYQTRETYLAWARVVFELAWFDQFPKKLFRQPPAGIYEVVSWLNFINARFY